jgi:hypothetical protein
MSAPWERVEEIFSAAAELPAAERAAYLDGACGANEELRREVESLFSHDDPSDPFVAAAVAGAAPTQKLPTGQMVGPYRIGGMLGEGGMGIVYKAEDTRLGRAVALKFVKTGFSERFQREAKAISALNHPRSATLYDVGRHEGAPYLALEYLEGKPVRGPLPLPLALEYAAQITGALEAAHSAGIIHRDLKPANIIVTPHGGVKALDFGLTCRVRGQQAGATRTGIGVVAGTPACKSPEQAQGKAVDRRTDPWPLGVALYEWALDNYYYRTDGYFGAIVRTPGSGGKAEPFTQLDLEKQERTHRHAQMLPGGKAIILTVSHGGIDSLDGTRIDACTLDTKKRKALLHGGFSAGHSPSGHPVYARGSNLYAFPSTRRAWRSPGPRSRSPRVSA